MTNSETFRPFATKVAAQLYGKESRETFDPLTILAIIEISILVFKGLRWLYEKLRYGKKASLANPDEHFKAHIRKCCDKVCEKHQLGFTSEAVYQAFLAQGKETSESEQTQLMNTVPADFSL